MLDLSCFKMIKKKTKQKKEGEKGKTVNTYQIIFNCSHGFYMFFSGIRDGKTSILLLLLLGSFALFLG